MTVTARVAASEGRASAVRVERVRPEIVEIALLYLAGGRFLEFVIYSYFSRSNEYESWVGMVPSPHHFRRHTLFCLLPRSF